MKFKLVKGVGKYSEGTSCIMSAAVAYKRVLDGMDIGEATDKLDCVCPVIRAFLIRVNDSAIWSDDLHRTNVLLPLIPRIVGTNNPELLLKRMFFLVNWSVKTIAPLILRWQNFEDHAEKLESLKDIVDYESANAANAVARCIARPIATYNYVVVDCVVRAIVSVTTNAANATNSYVVVGDATAAATAAANVVNVVHPPICYVGVAQFKEKIVVEVVKVLDQLLDIK